MLRHIHIRHPKPGTRPGALVEHADPASNDTLTVHALSLDAGRPTRERMATTLDEALGALVEGSALHWLHFEGDVPPADLARLGERFHLHPLALEDVHNHGQRPKLDPYRNLIFITLALPVVPAASGYGQPETRLTIEQVSLFIGDGFVLSFHAGRHDLFAPVRERMRLATDPITMGQSSARAEHLGHALADVVVDSAFDVVAAYGERLDRLEDEIFETRTHDLIGTIHDLRRALSTLGKTMRAQNEMIQRWLTSDHPAIHIENRPYIRDIQDHARRVVDLIDSYHDATGALLDTHLSLASMRLNDIMRVLTLIATVFMPLSFIVGVYGMNFDTASPWNMPELGWRYGYPIVLGLMGALVVGMLVFFRRRGWL